MKSKEVVFYLFLLINGVLYAQKDTIWFNDEWKVQVKDSAAFYRVSEHKEVRFKDYYHFTDYDVEGVKLKKGVSLDKQSDKFEGEVVYFRDGKYVSERILYRNGSAYGQHRVYYNSGKLQSVKNYDFGVLKGQSKVYYEDGALKETGGYSNNKRNGLWKVYYQDRRLKEQGQYHDGIRVGVWKVFYYHGIDETE